MWLIKDVLLLSLVTFTIVQCKSMKSLRNNDEDYDSRSVYSDYFDTTEKTQSNELETTMSSNGVEIDKNTTTTSYKSVEENEDETDDGVTCSVTNVTEILSAFYVDNFVLVLFRLNVTSHERELI